MGLAIIVPNVSFNDANLGKVTLSGNVPIRGLYINLEDSYIGSNVDLKCSYLPANTTQRNVVWSIESGSEYASISGSVLTILQGAISNEVILKCTSVSNLSISATKTITVTYNSGQADVVTRSLLLPQMVIGKSFDSSTGELVDNAGGAACATYFLSSPSYFVKALISVGVSIKMYDANKVYIGRISKDNQFEGNVEMSINTRYVRFNLYKVAEGLSFTNDNLNSNWNIHN